MGTARWNAERVERNAVHVMRKVYWLTNIIVGLEYESNPLHGDWAAMQRWVRGAELLLALRAKEHRTLDQPELWLDIKWLPV